PDRPGDEHPGGRDHLAGPADQDHDGIAGRGTLGGTALRRTAPCRSALGRTRLAGRLPVALLFFGTRTGLAALPLLTAGRLAGRRVDRRGEARRLGGRLR